ncbi:uncharacterized protein N7503_006540 [Penicillium pulvis]|uniref:uncharacterized protein n=1 Tax=Penicillium pulvis TaxID=1562058 RepID=UPI00254960C0|nr:uncharacterized protein N7503_006540 [Penicillium pulvis]KAJ5799035.1 hypothetical protein N7503_006540 [Penicillium pulvis]
MANRIEARTASRFGAYFSLLEGDFPPSFLGLSARTLIGVGCVDSVEVSIQSRYASLELG